MSISTTWNWEKNIGNEWLEPSMESYYYANLWKKENKLRLLDLGAGLGRHSMLFYDYGFKVTAVDITPYSVNYLRQWQIKRGISFPVIEADMLDLPFLANSFDAIYAYHTISHTNLEGFKKLFKKIHEILDNDGEIFFDVLSKKCHIYNAGFPMIDSNTVLSQDKEELNVPHICFDFLELKEILKDFTLLDVKEIRQAYNDKMDNGRIHYFIHARKK